ncbi:MAG: YafY family protein [Gammaproteobacteria bacterium]|jgi:predicted DNA-binding transcriptional regulator YafY|nr:YafY family protein [Gammaproteobacteria bacterium]MDP6734347.1 YafY family protein [Gammaproteobacteria bacterium]
MDRTERFYKIDHLLTERHVVAMNSLIEELGVSRATVKRDLEYMRDRLFAPIVWDATQRGYKLDRSRPGSDRYRLPGLWFNDQEIFALLTMHRLLSNLGNGLITPHVKPLLSRLTALMDSQSGTAAEVNQRIRILHMAYRSERPEHFEVVASATIKRRKLRIGYRARSSDEVTERQVSPQRLVHYRDNWYLDGWCHLRGGLRSFSLDCIEHAELLPEQAKPVSEKKLHDELASSYGIFSGKADKNAVLRFSPAQARWVAGERWHPLQVSRFDEDGCYILKVPYHNDSELVMDILKYGPDVEVISPSALRKRVKQRLAAALDSYS